MSTAVLYALLGIVSLIAGFAVIGLAEYLGRPRR